MVEVEFQGVWMRVARDGVRIRVVGPSATVFEEPLQVVVLAEPGSDRVMPVWMGRADAFALLRHHRGMPDGRPVASTVMHELLKATGGRVDHVSIPKLEHNAYSSVIHLRADGHPASVEARVSDALNLAVRARAPVLVAESLMAEVAFPADQLPGHLEELLRAGYDRPLEPGDWQPLFDDLIDELKRSDAA